ncbi:hypothetical protein F4703DRAFT_1025114 [Phycomyces blakesleeanus]
MVKFIKAGKVVVILQGRFAGKKAVVVRRRESEEGRFRFVSRKIINKSKRKNKITHDHTHAQAHSTYTYIYTHTSHTHAHAHTHTYTHQTHAPYKRISIRTQIYIPFKLLGHLNIHD